MNNQGIDSADPRKPVHSNYRESTYTGGGSGRDISQQDHSDQLVPSQPSFLHGRDHYAHRPPGHNTAPGVGGSFDPFFGNASDHLDQR